MANFWYNYVSGDPTLASSYSLAAGMPSCPPVGCCICAIFAPAGGATPTAPLAVTLRTNILNALTRCLPQPNVLVMGCPP